MGGIVFLEKKSFFHFSGSAPSVSSQNPLASSESPASKPTSPPQSASTSVFRGAPVYTGRDPAEFRPSPEEVKLFSAAQIDRIRTVLGESARAVTADLKFFDGWIEVGLYKKLIGDYIGARDAWEYAGVLQSKNSLSFANLGELYWHYLPDLPKAEENLKISIQHKSDDIQTYITLAELYHYSFAAKHNFAPQVLLDGLKSNPGNEGLMRRLAYLYEQREEWKLAYEWWQKVLDRNQGDAGAIEKVNMLKAKIGAGS